MGHDRCGVTITCGSAERNSALNLGKIVWRELQIKRSERFGEAIAPSRSNQRHDVLAARQYPANCDLRHRRAFRARNLAQGLDEREIVIEVFSAEARTEIAKVAGGHDTLL
jgi:hypothetical protein